MACELGRGPRQKNGKILTELSFFAGLKILISAPEVPFLLPPNWLKWGRFSQFGGTRNGTSGAKIKILRPPTPPN